MERYEIHPICACVPDMQAEEYALLREDIQRRGRIREPLVLFEGKILDGRHRYLVHQETAVPFTTIEFDLAVEGDPVEFVNARTIRRSMSATQRAVMSVKLQAFAQEREAAAKRNDANRRTAAQKNGAAERQRRSSTSDAGRTSEKLAKRTGASPRMIERATRLLSKGHPDLISAVDKGAMTLTEAETYLDFGKATQARIAAEPDRAKRLQRGVNATTRHNTHINRHNREVRAPDFGDVFVGHLEATASRLAFHCNLNSTAEIVAAFKTLDVGERDFALRLHCVKPLIEAIVQIAEQLPERLPPYLEKHPAFATGNSGGSSIH
jgi:hypothetical protein